MGHYEHSDYKCSESISEHPPKAFFIAGLFEQQTSTIPPRYLHFPNLRTLYLEAECTLTGILLNLISKARPSLLIKLSPNHEKIGEALTKDEDSDEDDEMFNPGKRYGILEDEDDEIDFKFM